MHRFNIDEYAEFAKKPIEKHGFLLNHPPEVFEQVSQLQKPEISKLNASYRDLRDLYWISIDDEDTFDLDQLTYGEISPDGVKKIYLAVSDVDAFVPIYSPLDLFASNNTTSIYGDLLTIHMMPEEISTNLTSLNEKEDRCALIFEMEITDEGEITNFSIYPAIVHNHARLYFSEVADWIINKVPIHRLQDDQDKTHEQILTQKKLKKLLKKTGLHKRVLTLPPRQDSLIIIEDRSLIRIEQITHNEAHGIVGNFVTAAHACLNKFVEKEKIPCLRRVIKNPDRWDRIIELAKERGKTLPHHPDAAELHEFLVEQQKNDPGNYTALSLAIAKFMGKGEYTLQSHDKDPTHDYNFILRPAVRCSAPNRRFSDLINQRLIKSFVLDNPAPYNQQELEQLAKNCTIKEDAAHKVHRHLNKTAIGLFLEKEIGKEFPALVTGRNDKACWVKLMVLPFVEGRLIGGERQVNLGDAITVKLIAVNISEGCIDFQRI